jgi:hypothetical protein
MQTQPSRFELPTLDAEGREERYQDMERQQEADLWLNLQDSLEAESFIQDWLDDPQAILANIIADIASATDKAKAFDTIKARIQEKIESVATHKAQRIFSAE